MKDNTNPSYPNWSTEGYLNKLAKGTWLYTLAKDPRPLEAESVSYRYNRLPKEIDTWAELVLLIGNADEYVHDSTDKSTETVDIFDNKALCNFTKVTRTVLPRGVIFENAYREQAVLVRLQKQNIETLKHRINDNSLRNNTGAEGDTA